MLKLTETNLPRITLDKPYGVFSAAMVIILHFCDTLLNQIESGLSDLYGENWKKKLEDDDVLPKEFNFRDPQAVLKELARNGASQLRFPLNSHIQRDKLAFFYDGLDDLLGERNAWVHRQLAETLAELNDLAKTTSKLLMICKLDFDYLNWIDEIKTTEVVNKPTIDVIPQTTNSVSQDDSETETSPNMENDQESEMQIGAPVSSRFLAHSYVVEINGDVSDRNTGIKLSEFNSKYQSTLKVLLSNLKVGSRLRLTQEGQLCSFFEDQWGFLTKINPTEWFPNHLK